MAKYGAFDILGPIMIGPSSSHTAGAARLAKIAAVIAGSNLVKVDFLLHGSFAKTYRGHGTDRALVAGILGMDPWDEKLKDSLEIAKQNGLSIAFKEADLGDVHPNTVKFHMTKKSGRVISVVGSSIGGGSIVITEVDGQKVQFTGEYPTLIINHMDKPGMISKITTLMYEENINIAFMRVFRSQKGFKATMVFETDEPVTDGIIHKIDAIGDVNSIKAINPIAEGE